MGWGSGIRDSGLGKDLFRIQGSKRHQIPDPDPQHWYRYPGARYNECVPQGAGNGQERADEEELDEFIISLRTQLEIFLNRSESRFFCRLENNLLRGISFVTRTVLRIRIRRIHMFLGFLNPNPQVRGIRYGSGSGPGSDPLYNQAKIARKTLIPTVLLLLFDFLFLKN
jgi:hypothetical protein